MSLFLWIGLYFIGVVFFKFKFVGLSFDFLIICLLLFFEVVLFILFINWFLLRFNGYMLFIFVLFGWFVKVILYIFWIIWFVNFVVNLFLVFFILFFKGIIWFGLMLFWDGIFWLVEIFIFVCVFFDFKGIVIIFLFLLLFDCWLINLLIWCIFFVGNSFKLGNEFCFFFEENKINK